MTCAPGSGVSSRPRVRFACRMSKPPLPSPSSRAWTFTRTSSPTSTAPVKPEYAIQGTPSTSSRTSPSCCSTTAVTFPRLSESGIDQRERHVDHRLEIRDGDPLVGRLNVHHPVREIEALQPPLVEDCRIGGAAAKAVANLLSGATQRVRRDADDLVVTPEAVAAVRLARFDVRA